MKEQHRTKVLGADLEQNVRVQTRACLQVYTYRDVSLSRLRANQTSKWGNIRTYLWHLSGRGLPSYAL
jgi:hypothetical protein